LRVNPLLLGGIALGVLVLLFVLHKTGLIDFSDKTQARGSGSVGSGFLGAAFDEVFHPVRHEAQLELERQTELPAPAPEADGDPLGVADTARGRRVIIELDEFGRVASKIGAPSGGRRP
jgi:hypothetical protein